MNKKVKAVSAKPFPWKCRECGKIAVRADIVSYPAMVEHDGRLYEFIVNGLKAPKCFECGEVYPDAEANRAISQAFRLRAKLLTPQQIRANREALGLTQKQLASALRIAEATVSRWETGAQIQQGSLDGLMRLFFEYSMVRGVLMDEHKLPQIGTTIRISTIATTVGSLNDQAQVLVSDAWTYLGRLENQSGGVTVPADYASGPCAARLQTPLQAANSLVVYR